MRGRNDTSPAQMIAETVGADVAAKLIENFGGTRIYIPFSIGDDHAICHALGREDADRVAAWAGGGSVDIPKRAGPDERHGQIVRERRDGGLTVAQIARAHNLSERHVYRILNQVRAVPDSSNASNVAD